jgi:hypothetical protein
MSHRNNWLVTLIAVFTILVVSSPSSVQAQDVWSPQCTPNLIHIYPDRLATRCQENGRWYVIFVADEPAAHIDRVSRALQAVQLSGKKVQFRDLGQVGGDPNARRFDILALIK